MDTWRTAGVCRPRDGKLNMSMKRGRHARPSILVRVWRRFVAWNEAETRRLDLELEMKARAVREARLRRSVR